jgi:hypothetical protein
MAAELAKVDEMFLTRRTGETAHPLLELLDAEGPEQIAGQTPLSSTPLNPQARRSRWPVTICAVAEPPTDRRQ